MDLDHDADTLIDRIGVLRQPSDLDLLVFFARHPRALLTSEQLAAFLGYGVKEIAASLDLLLTAGLITRTPNRTHAARLYTLCVDGPNGGWLPTLVRLASAREARLALIRALKRRSSQELDPHARVETQTASQRSALPFAVRKSAG